MASVEFESCFGIEIVKDADVVLGVVEIFPVAEDFDLVGAFLLPEGNATYGLSLDVSFHLTLGENTFSTEFLSFLRFNLGCESEGQK